MATAIRSTGCCAIAKTANLRQERWERSPSVTGAMVAPSATGLTSDLFCNQKSFMPKNGSRRSFKVGRVNLIRSKMFVPGFGEASPEAQAAAALHNFFTYVAVKIVSSQLEDYNKEAYVDLMTFLEKVPLKDGDKFIADLMRESFRHKNLALRIMEVRSAYAKQDFEWDNLQDLSGKQIEKANTALMRKFLAETSNME